MSNKMEVDILANNLLNSQLEITEELERLQRKVEVADKWLRQWKMQCQAIDQTTREPLGSVKVTTEMLEHILKQLNSL